ncbi:MULTISPECIES: sensor histidine kinase [unclassified Coleofasciculus]|uniref:sensor histidine kinase n=1 Tax=unclassified Coleofasciculus TaxID=2692782 RepID=UPI00187F2A43|nr:MULTISPECIES: response regulator [unclassified Coleofasciculus]MBE9126514.1 response regulator [Coleofasciculus sp. LEGE 07081]MBE9149889.1 response regulator [Coleofasciculus sp. LEGE 07092]
MTSSYTDKSQGYILLVDDQPDNLRLLSITLIDAGYNVKNAISAQMALIGIQTTLPELILLDIMMPTTNGYQLCQQLKADARTQEIPIIFLSALDNDLDKVKAFELGGADYITKPFQVQEVLARVKNQLTIVRQQQQIIEQNLYLQELNTKLRRSNTDLEQFASIVSHDLRSPLQTLKMFAQLLTQKYKSHLDKKANHYISRILEAGDRMEQLIQDLLNYARIEANAIEFKSIDCNTVLELVLENLELELDSTKSVITTQKLPTVLGNLTQLTQLFQNLICNAIKFHRPQVSPQIKISVEPRKKNSDLIGTEAENEEWLFGVHDNGIGIESSYFDRIFQVFQRLHTEKEYPGTGIGLAICKKIIECHGGCIWVESSPGIGTTVYFTIPIPSPCK